MSNFARLEFYKNESFGGYICYGKYDEYRPCKIAIESSYYEETLENFIRRMIHLYNSCESMNTKI